MTLADQITIAWSKSLQSRGYFTARQAHGYGFSRANLSHHAASGRFVRVARGLYRLKGYPSSPYEEVLRAWLSLGKDSAVVSHESALDLLGISDVVPDQVHVTLPRTYRGRRKMPGVRVHTANLPPAPRGVAAGRWDPGKSQWTLE